jgi:alpha-1,2-rhamnosyltransferase
MKNKTPQEDILTQERQRLLEFQLNYLRKELLYLTHERYRMTYSVSGQIYRFLRPIESRIASFVGLDVKESGGAEAYVKVFEQDAPNSANACLAQRLLVDVSGTIKRDAGTGIQRVVKEIMRAYCRPEPFEIPILAVRCENNRLFTANDFTKALGGEATGPDIEINVGSGDCILMLSDSWNAFDELAPVLEQIHKQGGRIITCIFDLIPELYPHACHEVTVPRYQAWLRRALLESDAFLAISKSVASELADYVEINKLPHRHNLKIGWFHCGADLVAGPTRAPREKIRSVFAAGAPVFLIVGTIEPRKGHGVALEAFEKLWASGVNAHLTIVGRRGWFEEAIMATIIHHAEYGRRLFWFDDADDQDLAHLYEHAAALIFPSYAEGFGLPIVEAARFGCPTICSDLPVLREVGRSGALYFRVNDPEALAGVAQGFLAGDLKADPQATLDVTWMEAAQRIVDILTREEWLFCLA